MSYDSTINVLLAQCPQCDHDKFHIGYLDDKLILICIRCYIASTAPDKDGNATLIGRLNASTLLSR